MTIPTDLKPYQHSESLIRQLKWFPPPAAKCSGDFYVEKVQLLVNWFKFSKNIADGEYYEYRVEMSKTKQFTVKGKTMTKKSEVAIPDRPALFWQHMRHERRENSAINVEEFAFDNKETVYSVQKWNNGFLSRMTDPTNRNVTYCLKLIPLRSFRPYFSRQDPMRDEEVDRSYKFLKTVMTQKVRYSPELTNAVSMEFIKNFVYDTNVIHRVPSSFHDPDRFDHDLEIAPRIEAWFGIYIGVKEASNGDPMLNFGIVDKLFLNAPQMSLLDYLLLLVDPETRNDDVREERKRTIRESRLSVDGEVRRRLDKYLNGIKLKSAKVWDPEKNKIAERHMSYIRLADCDAENCILQVSVRPARRGGPPPPTRPVPLCKIYADNEMHVNFPKLPLVVVKSGANEYAVPMEFLEVHERPQKYKSWIDGAMKDRYLKRTCREPHVYKEQTIDMLKALGFDDTEMDFVRSFGLSPELKMIQCPGKVLKEPRLVNKHNKPIKMTPVIRGFQEKQLNVVPDKELCCALFVLRGDAEREPCLSEERAVNFYKELIDGCEFRGIRIGEHPDENLRSLLIGEHDGQMQFGFYKDCTLVHGASTFQAAADHAKHLFEKLPDKHKKVLFFIVISERAAKAYGFIKHYCDTVLGIASQHVAKDTVAKVEMALQRTPISHRIAYQVALKINAKLKGVNQELEWSESGEMTVEEKERRKTMPLKMFVGIDVTHPTANSGIDYSIASVVASINPGGTIYVEQVVTQQELRPGERPVAHGRERTDILEGKFVKLLKKFAENNDNRAPDHIVIYRDGVSDSEMLRVSHEELRSLKMEVNTFLKARGETKDVQYTFIVVQKRHKTRLLRKISDKFPGDEEGGELDEAAKEQKKRWKAEMEASNGTGIVNPSSGTVCDKVIVSKYKFEFYLASHHGALGTSRPGHYTVMYDDSGLDKDHAYKMTYELTFLSARCRKPISLPAPVHYAHLSCEKAKEKFRAYKEYLQGQNPNPNRQYIESILQPNDQYPGMSFA